MNFASIELPDELIAAQKSNELVIFAGAGISVKSTRKYA